MKGSVKIFIPILLFMVSLGSVSWVVIDNLVDPGNDLSSADRLSSEKSTHLLMEMDEEPLITFTPEIVPPDDKELTRRMLAEGLIELPEVVVKPTPPVSTKPVNAKPEPEEEIPEPQVEEIAEEPLTPAAAEQEPDIPVVAEDLEIDIQEQIVEVPEIPEPDVFKPVTYKTAPRPDYPRPAERRKIEGTVIINALIGIKGEVLDAKLWESSGYEILDNAALDYVRTRWQFNPALKNGVPYEKWAEIPIVFTLNTS